MIPSFINKSTLPHKPGVYIYKDAGGGILYVGKAINLYHRVASYFNGRVDNPKTKALVENIRSCETIEVVSEIEALILEANLIKKYLPPYNIRLTDDKDYLYIKVTDESFPRVVTARKNELEDAKEFFGPFPSGSTVRATLKKLRRIFPWCSNPPNGYQPRFNRGQTSDIRHQISDIRSWSPCFYYHLRLCPGPCAGKISQQDYLKIIKLFSKFMYGKKDEVIDSLNQQMQEFSNNLQFEQAHMVKRAVVGIEYLTQSCNVNVYLENPNFIEDQNKESMVDLQNDLKLPTLPQRVECFDISNISGQYAVGSLVVLTAGSVDKKWYRKFKIFIDGKPNDFAMMAEIVRRRLKHPEWPYPDLILIDGGRGQVRAALEEIQKADLSFPVFGLAKRMEWLYPPDGGVVKLSKRSLSLRLLQQVRDEAHRFAITYHRKLRDRNIF